MTEETLYPLMQDLSGARTSEANHSGDIIKMDLWRTAQERGEAVTTSGPVDRSNYHGGQVFDPEPGLHRHVLYGDYSAMYPNIMRDINASPDTILGVGDTALMRSDYTEAEVQWSQIDPRPVKHLDDGELWRDFVGGDYKMVYDPSSSTVKWRSDWDDIQEHMTRIYFLPHSEREGLLSSRADQYIRWNKSYSGTMYAATKRTRNSLYGASSFVNFPLYDWRVGEATTLGGRMLLLYGRDALLDQLRARFDTDRLSVVIGDTDGFGISVDVDAPLDSIMPRVESAIEWVNQTGMPQFVEETFGVDADDTYHEIELESHAERLFVPDDGDGAGVKKTYAERVTVEDGEPCDELSVTGFEATRSDTSNLTTAVQTDVLHTILTEDRDDAKDAVYDRVRAAVKSLRETDVDLEDVGQRGGLSKSPEEYGTPDRSPQPIYRGALYAQKFISGEETFNKPMKYPVSSVFGDLPKCYHADTAEDGTLVDYIAVEDPSNIPSEIELDYEKMVHETLEQPLRPILRTMDWSWTEVVSGHEQSGLGAFADD